MQKIVSFLNSLKNKRVLVLMHSKADPDAFCSASALALFLKNNCKNVVIGAPDKPTKDSRKISETLKIPFSIIQNLSDFDSVILTDFSSKEMMYPLDSQLNGFKGSIAIIDHHASLSRKNLVKGVSYVDAKRISSTEILYLIANKKGWKITQKIALLLAIGILTDSAFFAIADSLTFEILSDLIKKSGKDYSEILSIALIPKDISERMAVLKAEKRTKIYRIKDFLITTSTVSMFQDSAASDLIRSGADLSFVAAEFEDKIKVSMRASNIFLKKNRFDLAHLIIPLLENRFGGSGGGHAGAAGYTLREKKEPEKILNFCVESVFAILKKKIPNLEIKEY